MLLAAALALAPCAFHEERGVLIQPANPTPQFQAKGKPWFDSGAKIAFAGGSYERYGLPRQMLPAELEAMADKDGVPIFVEAGAMSDAPEVIYLMVSSAECSFQPYARV